MTTLQWAAIAAIRVEPQYRFVNEESKLAKRMVTNGYLKSLGNKQYQITNLGLQEYEIQSKKFRGLHQ